MGKEKSLFAGPPTHPQCPHPAGSPGPSLVVHGTYLGQIWTWATKVLKLMPLPTYPGRVTQT